MFTRIKYIVHVMFENRSIDNVLGWLYDGDTPKHVIIGGGGKDVMPEPGYNGLRENTYYNKDKKGRIHYVTKGTDGRMDSPSRDPHEEFEHISAQCFDLDPGVLPVPSQQADMGGFYKDFEHPVFSADQIMQSYTPYELPVINGLAKQYAVCDAWYASVPTQTNCNRAFAATGNSIGVDQKSRQVEAWVNNHFDLDGLQVDFSEKTHWNVLCDNGFSGTDDWMVYYSEHWPPVGERKKFCYTQNLFEQLQDDRFNPHFAPVAQFMDRARSGKLPAYSFLEPKWGIERMGIGEQGTDYHPPCNVAHGEKYLNDIYAALTYNRDTWNQTLLVVTFDEHGGTYDHIPTPWGATPPWGKGTAPTCEGGFGFDRFGVRVPVILASPFIQPGTVFRMGEGVPFDHTSFIATLLTWKGIDKSKWGLGERVNAAPIFDFVLTLGRPRTDRPQFVPRTDPHPDPDPEANDLQVQMAHRGMAFAAKELGIPQDILSGLHERHIKPARRLNELKLGLSCVFAEMEKQAEIQRKKLP